VLLDVKPAVLGIGEHVDDLLGPALQADPPGERAAVLRQGMLREVSAVLLGEDTRGEGQPVGLTLEQEDQHDIGPAETPGAVDHCLQHGVEIRGGATQDGEHAARRRLLLTGLGEVAPELLDLLAQPPRGPDAVDHLASFEDSPSSQDQSARGTQVVCSGRRRMTTSAYGAVPLRERGCVRGAVHPMGHPTPGGR
jgi:hypothetical protein